MRILDGPATRAALPMADAIDAMRSAFGPDKEVPHRQLLGSSFFMAARVGSVSGIKVVSIVPGNPVGVVSVFDRDGNLVGSVDGPTLTAIRTGAAAGLATEVLAPRGATTFALVGAGAMGPDQIAGVTTVRTIESITIWNRDRDKAERLAASVGATVAETPDDAVRDADIVTTVTPSMTPLFAPSTLSPAAHINAMGAFTPDMVEIPHEVVRNAFRVVDDFDAAAAEAGDLLQAGVPPDAEIGSIPANFQRPDRVTLFKSVGIASQDVAAAAKALENAARLDLGTVV